jgi:SagB-type dehydrogenase family enzyme
MTLQSDIQQVLSYHEATKHHYHRYANARGYLDWANQPNPFRFWEGVDVVQLPFLKQDPDIPYEQLYERSARKANLFNLKSIGAFLELSMAISAWKGHEGSQWALRINPSSGNLHPTEIYLILPSMDGLAGGVFHYNPFLHALERRVSFSELQDVAFMEHFQTNGFLVAWTTIYWREAWKYGERAFRYCHHDAGHALAACTFSANLRGWKSRFLSTVSDEEVKILLGFGKQKWFSNEEEHPDALMCVHDGSLSKDAQGLPANLVSHCQTLDYQGKPNRLSEEYVQWNIIDQTVSATSKPGTLVDNVEPDTQEMIFHVPHEFNAIEVIRKRRSAVAFDGKTSITKEQFFAMLERTLPRASRAPFDICLGNPSVHLFLFVHRVVGLDPGLYFFVRNKQDLDDLRGASSSNFAWKQVVETFPLFFLKAGHFNSEATEVSCYQSIAGDSAFSLGQIARFRENIEKGPYRYRQLFWETGMVGQVLYLEAEALGIRATGIGCFFDDPVHQMLGLKDNSFQSLYHFTVGGPVKDTRLATLPAYQHLEAQTK